MTASLVLDPLINKPSRLPHAHINLMLIHRYIFLIGAANVGKRTWLADDDVNETMRHYLKRQQRQNVNKRDGGHTRALKSGFTGRKLQQGECWQQLWTRNEEVEARFPAQGESFGRATVWDPVLRRLFGFALHLFSSKFVLHHVNLGYFGTDRKKTEASTVFGDDRTLPKQHFTEKSSDGLCFTAKRDTPLCSRTLHLQKFQHPCPYLVMTGPAYQPHNKINTTQNVII